ncbi:MAG: branched-chain amino acid transport system ATP-binding protein livF, partial [Acidimicrobiaceae bacterium]|nr:branched-chain amino acid transport system ATP-binding protein livF [Acidimicrobiaceae bacterium]
MLEHEESFDEQVRRFTATTQKRDQIPSVRELAWGLAPDGIVYRPGVPEPKPPRRSLRERTTEALANLDPRGIAVDRRGLYALICLALLNTVAIWDDLIISTALPVMKVDMGFDFQFMLTLTAVVTLIGTLLLPTLGHLADRVKRTRMVQLGAVIANVSSAFVAVARTPGALVGARVAGSVGPAIQDSAKGSLSVDYFPVEKRARAIGFLQMASMLGGFVATVGIIFPMFVLGWFGWRVGIMASAIGAMAATVTLFWLREPVRGEFERRAMGVSEEQAKIAQKPVPWAEAWRSIGAIRTLRRMWYAQPFLTGGTSAGGLVLFVIQERAARHGAASLGPGARFIYTPMFIPLLQTVPTLLAFVATLYSVPLADRLMRNNPGRIMVLTGGVQLMSVTGMLLMAVSPWLISSIAFGWLVGMGPPLVGVAQGVLLAVIIPPRVRSLGMASIAPWAVLGLLVSPLVGGFADVFGPTAAVLVAVPIWLTGAFIYMSGGATVAADIRAAVAASAADDEAAAARRKGASKTLVCRDVDVTYEGTQVLFNVDFDVDEGELVAVLGTNGAGKSTLLRAICGLQEASNGAVFLDGEDVTHKPPHLNARDGIVFLPGGRAIFPTLTVDENLRAALWLYKDDDAYVAERTARVLDFFPVLAERMGERAGNMSGGEQQMLALSQAFLMRPKLLMIDELSLGLAPAVVEQLLGIVKAIRDEGTTVIVVEQSINVALTLAERSVFLDKGRKLFDGPTDKLLDRPDLVRSVFLGGAAAGGVRARGAAAWRAEQADTGSAAG